MPNPILDEDIALDPEEQLNTRIAWYYHIIEMTQQQIADRFGLTRLRVNKALAMCRETGIVQIRINSKLASCVRLEHELITRYGLTEAIVVPTPEDELFEIGLMSQQEAKSLRAAGAVGNLLGHCLNKDGEAVDHPLNRRVMSLSLEDLGRIKKVILVSGGLYKRNIIQAILRRLVHVLITDEVTAQALVTG